MEWDRADTMRLSHDMLPRHKHHSKNKGFFLLSQVGKKMVQSNTRNRRWLWYCSDLSYFKSSLLITRTENGYVIKKNADEKIRLCKNAAHKWCSWKTTNRVLSLCSVPLLGMALLFVSFIMIHFCELNAIHVVYQCVEKWYNQE